MSKGVRTMDNVSVSICSDMFVCEKCHYTTVRQSQYNRHILTPKHKRIILDNKMDNLDNELVQAQYQCHCGKTYNYLSGLCKHKKKCKKHDTKKEIVMVEHKLQPTFADDNNKLRRMIQIHFWEKWSKTNDVQVDSDFAPLFPKVDYNKIILEATGGGSKYNDTDIENKIMRKIAKVIGIDKNNF